jgi:hypothetical protein
MRVSITGIAWYHEGDYLRLRALFEDEKPLHPSYQEWLKAAERLTEQLRRDGNAFQKVYIDPNTFPLWCADRGLKIDSKARMRFANEFVARKDPNQHR